MIHLILFTIVNKCNSRNCRNRQYCQSIQSSSLFWYLQTSIVNVQLQKINCPAKCGGGQPATLTGWSAVFHPIELFLLLH